MRWCQQHCRKSAPRMCTGRHGDTGVAEGAEQDSGCGTYQGEDTKLAVEISFRESRGAEVNFLNPGPFVLKAPLCDLQRINIGQLVAAHPGICDANPQSEYPSK